MIAIIQYGRSCMSTIEPTDQPTASEQQLIALIEASIWTVVLVDRYGHILAVSPFASEIIGNAMVGKHAREMVVDDGWAHQALEQALHPDTIISTPISHEMMIKGSKQAMTHHEIQVCQSRLGPWRTIFINPYRRTERRTQILLSLNRVAPQMLAASDELELYDLIAQSLEDLSLIGSVALHDPATDQFILRVTPVTFPSDKLFQRFQQSYRLAPQTLQLDRQNPLIQQVLHDRRAIVDQNNIPIIASSLPEAARQRMELLFIGGVQISQILAPLQVGAELRGMFMLFGPGLEQDDLPVVEALTNQIAAALRQVELRKQMEAHIARLELLVANVPDALIIVRPDLSVQSLNKRPLRMVGYEQTAFDQLRVTDLTPARYHEELIRRWKATQTDSPQRFDLEMFRQDGSTFIASITAAKIPGSDEILAVATDVTARRRLFEAEKLAALGRLVAGVAHELNNPLAIILGLIQLNLHDELPEGLQQDLRYMEQATQRAARIVQQLSIFVRPPSNQPQAIEPQWLAKEVQQHTNQLTQHTDIQTEMAIEPNAPTIRGDPIQIRQVLFNILQNAIQSLDQIPTDRARWIHVRFWGERDRLRITIHDNGPGIAAEHLPHLFEPFFTTQELGRGVGLGLAIAYTIVQQHSGSIWAESNADGGAIFSISLPAMYRNPEGSFAP
ncbi:MAG: hypothetical protein Fur005_13390 [Roseiflexaceae bacterium]